MKKLFRNLINYFCYSAFGTIPYKKGKELRNTKVYSYYPEGYKEDAKPAEQVENFNKIFSSIKH